MGRLECQLYIVERDRRAVMGDLLASQQPPECQEVVTHDPYRGPLGETITISEVRAVDHAAADTEDETPPGEIGDATGYAGQRQGGPHRRWDHRKSRW